MTLTTNF